MRISISTPSRPIWPLRSAISPCGNPHESNYSAIPGRAISKMHLPMSHLCCAAHATRMPPQRRVRIAASTSYQLTRRSSQSGAGGAARSQPSSNATPSPICASPASHNGGPCAGALCGGSEPTPMRSSVSPFNGLTERKAFRDFSPNALPYNTSKT